MQIVKGKKIITKEKMNLFFIYGFKSTVQKITNNRSQI